MSNNKPESKKAQAQAKYAQNATPARPNKATVIQNSNLPQNNGRVVAKRPHPPQSPQVASQTAAKEKRGSRNSPLQIGVFSMVVLAIVALLGYIFLNPASKNNISSPAPFESVSDSTLRFVPGENQGTLEIWVDNVSKFYALDMEVHFDASQSQVYDADSAKEGIQISPGQTPAPDFVAENTVDNEAGVIRYVVTQVAPRDGFSGSGLVATITWQEGFESPSDITFGAVTLVNQDGQPIKVATAHSSN